MPSNRARQLKRERQRMQRSRSAHEDGARETQRQQMIAAARRDSSRHRRRHAIAFILYGVAAILAVSHAFEHFGTFTVMSPGLSDLLIGWPMAALMALTGAIIYGK